MARLITKTEVACERNFLSLTKLITVTKLPEMPSEESRQAKIPVARVADSVSASPLMSASEEVFFMFDPKTFPPLNLTAYFHSDPMHMRLHGKVPSCDKSDSRTN